MEDCCSTFALVVPARTAEGQLKAVMPETGNCASESALAHDVALASIVAYTLTLSIWDSTFTACTAGIIDDEDTANLSFPM